MPTLYGPAIPDAWMLGMALALPIIAVALYYLMRWSDNGDRNE